MYIDNNYIIYLSSVMLNASIEPALREVDRIFVKNY